MMDLILEVVFGLLDASDLLCCLWDFARWLLSSPKRARWFLLLTLAVVLIIATVHHRKCSEGLGSSQEPAASALFGDPPELLP